MNEMIAIVRGLSTGAYFEFHGRSYDIEPIKLAPAPTAPIPILIGGHSEAALRRAARSADGWMHARRRRDRQGAVTRVSAAARVTLGGAP